MSELNAEGRIDQWLRDAIADAERRGIPALKPMLEALAHATRTLRAADFADNAAAFPVGRASGARSDDDR